MIDESDIELARVRVARQYEAYGWPIEADVVLSGARDHDIGIVIALDGIKAGRAAEKAALAERVMALENALAKAQAWHESEDKALSKSGRSDTDYRWRRHRHWEALDEIGSALTAEQYNAAWDRMNAEYEALKSLESEP